MSSSNVASWPAHRFSSSQGYGFPSGHVWMWELDCEESWVLKNWCFWTVVLEKTLLSPLDCKEIQPVHPKVNQSWIFIGRTDDEAETPILWLPHAQSWLIGKDPDAGRDWGQKEKGATGDEMAGWHHRLNAHEFGWTPGVSDGQGGLECCDSWGRKESDMTERLNWTALKLSLILSVGFVFCHNDQIFIYSSTKTRLFMKTNFYCNTWWKQPSLYFLFIWIFLVDLKNLVLEVNLKSTSLEQKFIYRDMSQRLPWWLRQLRFCPKGNRPISIHWLGRSPEGGHGNPFSSIPTGESHRQRSLVGIQPINMLSQTKLRQLSCTNTEY